MKDLSKLILVAVTILISAKGFADNKEEFINVEAQFLRSCGVDENPGLRAKIKLVANALGHGPLIAKQLMGGIHGVYGIWEIVREGIDDSIRLQTKEQMVASYTCYGAMGIFLTYQNLGIMANNTIAQMFGNDEVRYLHSYVPASLEQQKLYEECSTMVTKELRSVQDAQWESSEEARAAKNGTDEILPPDPRQSIGTVLVRQMEARAGVQVIYRPWALENIYSIAIQKALIAKNPKTCEDVKAIDEETMKKLIAADIRIRQQLGKMGIKIPYKNP